MSEDAIAPGKRYWLKSSSRRQRVRVEPQSALDLKSGQWSEADSLPLNAIGKVHLAFDETAIFDSYEANRATGAFILIDPDTNNTVAGGMITAKSGRIDGIGSGGKDRVLISLPADVADEMLASEAFAALRDQIEIRRVSGHKARAVLDALD